MDNKILLKVEQFDYFKFNRQFSKFNVCQNMVAFFDIERTHIIDNYIQVHIDALSQRLKKLDSDNLLGINYSVGFLNFSNLPSMDYPVDLENIINYYIPFLSDFQKEQFKFTKNSALPEGKIIADYLGYKGAVKKGFIFFKDISAYVVEYNELEIQDKHEEFFDSLFRFLKAKIEEDEYDDLPFSSPFYIDPYENLDEDALAKINEIKNQLYELKKSGHLLFALPILKELLKTEANEIDFDGDSNLLIDEDYRILLPIFNNLEIQLSHLTKAVYVLFCNNPDGINIKQLYRHKTELLDLYSKISYQLDYDKIQQSIEDLVKLESKAIYTHISRIKSAFYKQMDYEFAENYIVTGNKFGNDFKYIPFFRNKCTLSNLEDFGIDDD